MLQRRGACYAGSASTRWTSHGQQVEREDAHTVAKAAESSAEEGVGGEASSRGMRAVPLQCLCDAYRQLLMIKRVWGASWLLEPLHRVKTADGFTLGGMPQLSTSVMWHLCFPAVWTAVTYVLHVYNSMHVPPRQANCPLTSERV